MIAVEIITFLLGVTLVLLLGYGTYGLVKVGVKYLLFNEEQREQRLARIRKSQEDYEEKYL